MKDEPLWLELAAVEQMHLDQLAEHGGLSGVRDQGMLESALGRPKNNWLYTDGDLFDLAAVYAHGICRNHPFVDGNKRTAFLAAYTFLLLHGHHLTANPGEATAVMLRLAADEIGAEEFAAWLRLNVSPLP